MNQNFRYRADIDGLRALAIIPVLFFHASLGFTGGYVGVDVFFVISGFLITSIVAREIQNGSFTYKDFWERRIRRIFPASFVVTVVTFLVGFFVFLPPGTESLAKAALAQVLMVANFYFWQQDGYFAGPSDLEPFLQMWSLAVEEQFYLLLPLLLTFTFKRGLKRVILILSGIAILSFVWSIIALGKFPAATFFLLPSRAWELLLGSLLAFVPIRQQSKARSQILATLGLALILGPVFLYDKTTAFPGLAALPPCLGTVLLIYAHGDGSSWIKPLLASRPVVWIGKISFSLYLWHWPLLAYARLLNLEEPSPLTRGLLVLASIILAVLSWRFIEQPFRKKTILAERKPLFRRYLQATLFSGIIFTAIYKLDGIPARFQGDNARYAEAAMELPGVPYTDLSSGKFPLLIPESDLPETPILVWGDSHADSLFAGIADLLKKHERNCFYATRGGTPPLLDVNFYPNDQTVAPFNDEVLKLIDTHKIETVILASRWTHYLVRGEKSRKTSLTDRDSNDRHPDTVFEESLRKTIAALEKRNIRVFIVSQVPRQHRSAALALWTAKRVNYPADELGITIAEHNAYQRRAEEAIQSASAGATLVTLVDPLDRLSHENGHTIVEFEKGIFYYDDNHLSKAGARHVAPLLEEAFLDPQR